MQFESQKSRESVQMETEQRMLNNRRSSVENDGLANITRRSTNEHLELALRLQPSVLLVAPRRNVVLAKREFDLYCVVLVDPLAPKVTQYLWRLA